MYGRQPTRLKTLQLGSADKLAWKEPSRGVLDISETYFAKGLKDSPYLVREGLPMDYVLVGPASVNGRIVSKDALSKRQRTALLMQRRHYILKC